MMLLIMLTAISAALKLRYHVRSVMVFLLYLAGVLLYLEEVARAGQKHLEVGKAVQNCRY
jgi:hypothetical protein